MLPAFAIGIRVTGSTHVERAAEACNVSVRAWHSIGDNGQSITFASTEPRFAKHNTHGILCMLERLDAPPRIVNQVGNAEANDGEKNAERRHFTASWNYHPTSGLGATITSSAD